MFQLEIIYSVPNDPLNSSLNQHFYSWLTALTMRQLRPASECVLSLSGTTDISFIDPVVIGRNAFSVTNDFVSGAAAYIQDVLCAILDVTLVSLQGKAPSFHTVNCTVDRFNYDKKKYIVD